MSDPWDGKPDGYRTGYQDAQILIPAKLTGDLDYLAGYESGLHERLTNGSISPNKARDLMGMPPVESEEGVVETPSHYTSGSIDVANFITDQKLNYPLGNVVKYVTRAGKKNPEKEQEDLRKAAAYLQMAYNLARGKPAVVYSEDGKSIIWDLFQNSTERG